MPLPAFVCEQCGQTFASQGSLDQHVKDKSDHVKDFECMRDFVCKVCGDKFRKEDHLKMHFTDKHHTTFTCQQTGKCLHVNEVQGHARSYLQNLKRSDYMREEDNLL